jgi:hypothetical protein
MARRGDGIMRDLRQHGSRRVIAGRLLAAEALGAVYRNSAIYWCPRGDSNTRHAV